MSVDQHTIAPAKLGCSAFMDKFGGLYEHSPWIAEQVWDEISSQQLTPVDVLAEKLRGTVDAATKEQKLQLLRAHPELAGKAATESTLTAESTEEQSRARLDLCSPAEYEKFQSLNTAYNERFDFPFIMAVRNSSRAEILAAFEARLHNSISEEFDTAIEQVHQIALLRLKAAVTTEVRSNDAAPSNDKKDCS